MGGLSGPMVFSIVISLSSLIVSYQLFLMLETISFIEDTSSGVHELMSSELNEKIRILGFVTYREAGTKKVLMMDIEIVNLGRIKYALDSFKMFDLIMGYFLWPDGNVWVSVWIPYDPGCSLGSLCWRVLEVYREEGNEVIDPVDTLTLSGHWNPSEIIKIRVTFSPGMEPYYILRPNPEGGFSITFVTLLGSLSWINSVIAKDDLEI